MINEKNKLNLQVDLRIVVGVLLAIIVAMVLAWKPWVSGERSDEVIKVTGETTLKATPDQYVFSPVYQFMNADKAVASEQAKKKSDEVVAKLKELNVAEDKIKSDINGFSNGLYRENPTEEYVYTAQLTVTVNDRTHAQQVQDYLSTTSPLGGVTPQASFSETKNKELQAKARDEATKDARAKAVQSANNLGFKLGRVKAVEDGAGFGDVIPFEGRSMPVAEDSKSRVGPTILPGENEIRYSVTVTYFVR